MSSKILSSIYLILLLNLLGSSTGDPVPQQRPLQIPNSAPQPSFSQQLSYGNSPLSPQPQFQYQPQQQRARPPPQQPNPQQFTQQQGNFPPIGSFPIPHNIPQQQQQNLKNNQEQQIQQLQQQQRVLVPVQQDEYEDYEEEPVKVQPVAQNPQNNLRNNVVQLSGVRNPGAGRAILSQAPQRLVLTPQPQQIPQQAPQPQIRRPVQQSPPPPPKYQAPYTPQPQNRGVAQLQHTPRLSPVSLNNPNSLNDRTSSTVPPVKTLDRFMRTNEDGSTSWGYTNEDGSFKEETRGVDCVVRGKYGYVDPEGVRREYEYQSGNPCDPNKKNEEDEEEEGLGLAISGRPQQNLGGRGQGQGQQVQYYRPSRLQQQQQQQQK